MRAPADSTKPITGTRERSASSSTATTVSACASPSEPPANEASCAKHGDGAAVDAPAGAEHAVAGARLLPHAPREHLGAQQVERAGVAEHLQALERRQPLIGSRDECEASCCLQTEHGVVAAEAERVGDRDRAPRRRRARAAGRGRARSRGRARGRAARSPSVGGIDARRAARGSSRPPRRRRRRRAGARSPTWSRTTGIARGALAERGLQRDRLGAVVERRRGAVRVDVVDVRRRRRRRRASARADRRRGALAGRVAARSGGGRRAVAP